MWSWLGIVGLSLLEKDNSIKPNSNVSRKSPPMFALTWSKQWISIVPPSEPDAPIIASGRVLTISPMSKTTSTTESSALSNI